MKFILTFLLYCILSLFTFNNFLFSQEIVEESSSEKKTSNYWDKHFKLNFGTSYAKVLDGQSYRNFTYAGLTWKQETKWIDFNVEALAYRRDFQYYLVYDAKNDGTNDLSIQALNAELAYKTEYDKYTAGTATKPDAPNPAANPSAIDICNKYPSSPFNPFATFSRPNVNDIETNLRRLCSNKSNVSNTPSFALGIVENQVLWREANVILKFGDKVQLLLGNHVVVWGQLDFLSSVDFWLPLRLGSSGTGLTKADNRNPQTMALLSVFPLKWMEFQLYLFPDTGIDPIFLNNLITRNADQNSEYYSYERTYIPSGKDLFRYAGRALFYLDKTTIGFTWYQGFFQFAPRANSQLIQDTKYDQVVYKLRGQPELERINVYGFELAHTIGKWILKDDFSYTQLYSDFSSFDLTAFNNQALGFLAKDNLFNNRQSYINWVLQSNQGRLGIVQNNFINSIGVDSNLDRWLFNLSLLVFYTSRTPNGNVGRKLAIDASPPPEGGNPFGSSDISAVPSFNIAYYLDNQKKEGVGIAGGFLNTGLGFIGYYAKEVYESLKFSVNAEYLLLFAGGLAQVPGYKLNNPAFPALRLTLDYSL